MEHMRKTRGKLRAIRTVFHVFSTTSVPLFPHLSFKAPVFKHFLIRLSPKQKRIPKHPTPVHAMIKPQSQNP